MKHQLSVLGLCLFFSVAVATAQTNTQQSINTPALTAVLPPAPNAYQLTKYSGLPLNLSNGTANATIPLGEIRDGAIVVPVSLSYNSGNGIRINQLASRVGTSWNLNAGGVISRTVFGKPDESTKWLMPPANLQSATANTPEVYQYLDSAAKDLYDTQADLFSFECNGYSGKFYLKQTDKTKVVQLSASPLRIETNFNNEFSADWTLRITDPNGIKYYFGGSSATEKTKTVPYGAACGKSFDIFIATAWYLKKIEGVHGELVSFSYNPVTFDYLSDFTETMIRTPQGTLNSPACPGGNCPQRTEDQLCASNLRSQGVILTGISGRFSSASFGFTTRPDIDGDYLVSTVDFNKTDPATNTASLAYSYSLNYTNSYNNSYYNAQGNTAILCTRPFLVSVVRSAAGLEAQKHIFDYYNMNGLPSRLSYAQDYWGFSNGKSNTHLLPTSSDPMDAQIFPALANREPDATYSVMGLLRKITYPSGGADSLEYESNTVYDTRTAQYPKSTLHAIRQGTGNRNPVSYTTTLALGAAQNVSFDLSCQYSGSGVDDQIHQHAILDVRDQGNYSVYNYVLPIGQNHSKQLTLGGGNYTVTMTVYGEAAVGEIYVGYYPQGSPVTSNYAAGGVRVLRNISIPVSGPTLRKKLIYATLDNLYASSGVLREIPDTKKYYTDLIDGKNCPDWSVASCTYRIANSSPVSPLNYITGGHIFYRDVIELDDDQWRNGGTAHHYLGGPGWNALLIRGSAMNGLPLTSYGLQNGLEDQTRDFKVTGTGTSGYTYKVVREVKKHYRFDYRRLAEQDNFVVKRRYLPTATYNPPNDYMFAPFDLAMFSHVSTWVYPDTTTVTTYDVDGAQPLVNTTVEVYENTAHLQPNRVITNMSDGRQSELNIKYPHEMVADGYASPYTDLIAANRITVPVIKTELTGSTTTQSTFTPYQPWGNGVFEPSGIKYALAGSGYQDFISFHAYDSDGKLLSQSKTGGAKSSYQYGYQNRLPVAECKNALPSEFFFENFEDKANESPGGGHTGLRFRNGDYALGWVPPNGRTYRLTYFYLENGRWKFARQAYSGPTTLTLGDAIDDVAIYPADALIKTVTMDPFTGITSMIDERGNTTYFEYDQYNRLVTIKDQNRDIVKTYAYHEVLGLGNGTPTYLNTEQSQSFTRQCTTGSGSSIIYTVPAGSYASSVSQADANNQAMAEVQAKGQAYANEKGTCSTANATISYTKDTQGSSGGVATLNLKNSGGTVLYSFSEAQLTAGVSFPPGIYNLEFLTYGTTYNPSTHNGWTKIYLFTPEGPSAGVFYNTDAPGGAYYMNNINLSNGNFAISVSRVDSIE